MRNGRVCLAGVAIILTFLTFPAMGQLDEKKEFAELEAEKPQIRSARHIVPRKFLQTELYEVHDEVETVESLYLFKIESDFGEFQPYGELLFRIRLQEIQALEVLRGESNTEVAVKGVGRSAADSVKSVGRFAKNPVATSKGVPGGIKRMFGARKREAKGVAKGDEEKKQEAIRSAFNIGEAERKLCQRLQVDPYTSNEPLRKEIQRVGKIEAIAGLGTDFVIPVVGLVKQVYGIAWQMDAYDLRDYNEKRLVEAGIDPEIARKFLYYDTLTPTHQTFLVSALLQMEDVEDREVALEQALSLESESEVLFFIEGIVMMSWYHQTFVPMDRMVWGTGIPVALSEDGRVMVFTGADFADWTDENEQIIVDFTDVYKDLSDQREIWISGGASRRTVEAVGHLGWIVHPNVRPELRALIPWGLD